MQRRSMRTCYRDSNRYFNVVYEISRDTFTDLFWSIASDGAVLHVPCPLRKADGSIAVSRLRAYLDPLGIK